MIDAGGNEERRGKSEEGRSPPHLYPLPQGGEDASLGRGGEFTNDDLRLTWIKSHREHKEH